VASVAPIAARRNQRIADAIKPAPSPDGPASDRAPDWVAGGTPEPLRSGLEALLGPEQVLSRASDIVRYASDASPYRQFPQVVVRPRSDLDVAKLAAFARERGVPIVFRAGGTSLNGQGQSDGILVDIRHGSSWRGVEALEDGAAARVRPGTILGHANRVLAPHGTRLGPDPASTDIATLGGVLANNSGGMRCGTTEDTYSTLRSLRFVLPSGTTIDTAEPGGAERFEREEPELAAGLAAIRDEIRADGDLRERIRRKFEIKNTTGYRLCGFLDADEPLEIFKLLLVGSEGTLAFVSEATLETVPVPPVTTTAWVHFASIDEATKPVGELIAAGARAVELMVAPALLVAAHSIPGTPEYWKELDHTTAVLLVEFGADDADGLAQAQMRADDLLESYEVIRPQEWQLDHEQIELAWRVREGLHGLIGKLRLPGTALIVEDVCVPPARIAECAVELQALLGEHGFLTGVAGHASAGNLHFMLTPDFSKPEDLERYDAFMAKLVEMIVGKYDGSLKAEHGTGVNMAPFVELEWGEQATEIMWRIKALADPDGVFGPGVVLNRDPRCHLENLKTTPEVEESVTSCVECGFCEPVCPSRDLTTTPRQRIVLRREMARQPAGSPVLDVLAEEFVYDGLDTCAVDGSCALTCPLGIDTGKLVKELRAATHGPRAARAAELAADRWKTVEGVGRAALRTGAEGGLIGRRGMARASGLARKVTGPDAVPAWVEPMPPPAEHEAPAGPAPAEPAAVYMPSCTNRIFGSANGSGSLQAALVAVSERAGSPVLLPDEIAGTCCGVPQGSKGFPSAQARKLEETVDRLWEWTRQGELPVVVDATSCTHGLVEGGELLSDAGRERHAQLEIVDSIEWGRRLLANLTVAEPLGSITVHPTCASRKLGLDGALAELAGALADEVHVPVSASCCGFAGDRGFLHPELTAAALAPEAAEVAATPTDAYVCANRTCEIGLRRETGQDYASVIQLLERLTRV
jgi:D-lactate dehydrogenase